MTPLFLSPSLPQVDEEGGERGAEGLGGGGRGGGEEVIGTSGGTREMLNMKIISDRLVLDGRNVVESETFFTQTAFLFCNTDDVARFFVYNCS